MKPIVAAILGTFLANALPAFAEFNCRIGAEQPKTSGNGPFGKPLSKHYDPSLSPSKPIEIRDTSSERVSECPIAISIPEKAFFEFLGTRGDSHIGGFTLTSDANVLTPRINSVRYFGQQRLCNYSDESAGVKFTISCSDSSVPSFINPVPDPNAPAAPKDADPN